MRGLLKVWERVQERMDIELKGGYNRGYVIREKDRKRRGECLKTPFLISCVVG
jgi:hypothetical protein